MSENTATEPTDTPEGEGVDQQAQAAADDQTLTGKPQMTAEDLEAALREARKEAAKYRTERNEYRSDAEKFREQQEAEKTELQRAQEAQAKLEAELSSARVVNQRLTIVSKYGIAEDNIDLLGNDPEKFEANAERIAALQEADARRAGPPSEIPVESLRPGASSPKDTPDYSYPSSWPVTGPFANN